ncbi:unnamed protein product, partial [Heligmosomoides polygyrus]|uniref:Uncharacterized protein n=1 Tax=Heligmosomoides polygyrus TaxID=6339 RepID=A0A183FP35_HELPZ
QRTAFIYYAIAADDDLNVDDNGRPVQAAPCNAHQHSSKFHVEDDILHTFINAVRALPVTADEVREATGRDHLLRQVMKFTTGSWPKKITRPDLLCFSNRRDSLSTLNGSELCIGRNLRTPLSMLKPVPDFERQVNLSLETQFNHHHGTKSRTFKPGKESWADGLVVKRIGRVLYKIKVGDELWTRHANQLRIRLYDSDDHKTKNMDTLFETFGLERPQSLSRPANIQNSTAPALPEVQRTLEDQNCVTSPPFPVQEAVQPRRSGRSRRPTIRFDMDPRHRSYNI